MARCHPAGRRLEQQFQRDLHDAWSIDRLPSAKRAAVIHVAVYLIELRVVEGIEKLRAKLQVYSFLYRGVLHDCDVPIVDPGPAKEPPGVITRRAQRFWAEQAGVKVRRSGSQIGEVERSRGVVGSIDGERDCTRAVGSGQGIVVTLPQSDR